MQRFDAIVVGAGPAGSTTAYRLASAGASVVLLDRARFPRDKPCGGGLTGRALKNLPCPVDPVVEHVVDRVTLRLRFSATIERRASRPLILMTQRRRLDLHLAEQAAAAGADFRDGVRVDCVEVGDDGAVVSAGGERLHAAVVVGADGANGIAAKATGLAADHDHGVAYEGNVDYDAATEKRYRRRAVIELGEIPGGYGWVFPKGDHVNVGVGGWFREGPNLKHHLVRLCEQHGIGAGAVESLRGHRLPLRRPGARLSGGRALLVGDAAGLVDPLTGDGMYEAFVSSRLASAAVLDLLAGRADGLEPYTDAVTRELGRHLAASWGVKLAIDRYPRAIFALTRLPLVWGAVERLIAGELSHPGAARGLVRGPLRLIELLARAAGDPGRPYKVESGSPV
jgi:geranylgeranyl reductase family protein